jgi:PAS domain S-box-containing protein
MQHTARHHATARKVDKGTLTIHIGVVWFAIVLLVILLVWFVSDQSQRSLDLRFNPYAIVSILSVISNVVAFALIVRIKRHTDVLKWFSTFLLSVASWGLGETMIRLSASPAAAAYWAPVTTIGSVLMPISLYMFALMYTRPNYSFQPFVLPSLLGVSTFFILLDNHTNLITLYDPSKMTPTPWGYVAATGPGYWLISLWLVLLSAAAAGLLYHFRRETVDRTLHKQATLFVIAIIIPLIGGAITDGVLPSLNIDIIPPMSVMLLTITGVIISYGVLRYRFFSFTPGQVADEILGTMNEAVIGIRSDFRITYANNGAEQLLGMPASQLLERRIFDLLQLHLTPTELQTKISAVLGKSNFGTIDSIDFQAPGGSKLTAKLSVTKIDSDSRSYGYLLVMTDITAIAKAATIIEHKVAERTHELHEEQAKLRASIEGLSLGFMLVDEQGKIIIQNEVLQHLFGLKTPVNSLGDVEQRLSDFNLTKACASVRASRHAKEVKEIGMGTKILHLYIGPVEITGRGEQQVIGTVILVQDITEEKVLARSKDEFFSIASHELRTPLTTIKGNASMMIDYYKGILAQDPSFSEMVYDIHTSSARLIEIVGDFLDVSRVEQGKMVFRPSAFALEKIIETVAYEMRTVVHAKKVDLSIDSKTLDGLPLVWADRDRLTQIVYNLVGNAVKFTDTGTIAITCKLAGKAIRLTVADTGRGIPLENQKLLFHKFQQAGSSLLTRDTTRGTGLGLYISKLMSERMNCTIGLEHSEEGKGSTFYVIIPLATEKQLNTTPTATTPHREKIDTTTGLSKE